MLPDLLLPEVPCNHSHSTLLLSCVLFSGLVSLRIQTSLLRISYDDLPLWCWHYSFLFSSAVMNIFLWSYHRQSGRECVFIPLFCSYFWITYITCNNAANIYIVCNNVPANQLLYSCCVVSKRNFNFLICSSFPFVLSFFFFFLSCFSLFLLSIIQHDGKSLSFQPATHKNQK